MLKRGDRIKVNGDSEELWIKDYKVKVSIEATVVETPSPRDKKVLVSLDNIDGEYNVCCRVRKSKIENNSEPKLTVSDLKPYKLEKGGNYL